MIFSRLSKFGPLKTQNYKYKYYIIRLSLVLRGYIIEENPPFNIVKFDLISVHFLGRYLNNKVREGCVPSKRGCILSSPVYKLVSEISLLIYSID